MDKGGALFIGWSINTAGPFPQRWKSCYLLVAMDPFSKWVGDLHTVPLLHSWRVAEFLYDNLVAHWGKPRYVQTNNGAEFVGSFAWLCKGLGIIQHHICCWQQ